MDGASISVASAKAMNASTEAITDDSDTEADNLNDFDVSSFDAE